MSEIIEMTKERELRKKKIIAELVELTNPADPENAHARADDLICELLKLHGERKAVKLFKEIEKWYA